jgi:hypothetical protein
LLTRAAQKLKFSDRIKKLVLEADRAATRERAVTLPDCGDTKVDRFLRSRLPRNGTS